MLDQQMEIGGAEGLERALGAGGLEPVPCELCDHLEVGPCPACNGRGWRSWA